MADGSGDVTMTLAATTGGNVIFTATHAFWTVSDTHNVTVTSAATDTFAID